MMIAPLYYEAMPQEVLDYCHRLMRQYLKINEQGKPLLKDPKRFLPYAKSACDKSLLYFIQLMHRPTVESIKLEIVRQDPKTDELFLGFHGLLACLFQMCVELHLHMGTEAPRGFAKSLVFGTFGLEWLGLHPHKLRNREISYITSTGGLAAKRNDYIQRDFEFNPQILALYGNQHQPGFTWNSEHLRLANGVDLYFHGWQDKEARGPHPSFALVDDIESKESARSPTLTQNVKDWLWFDFWGQLGADDPFLFNGTPCGRGTAIDEVFTDPTTQKPRHGFTTFRFKASAVTPITGKYEGEGLPYTVKRSIWPSEWPNKKLKEQKLDQMGVYAYDSELQCEPHGTEDPVIRLEWIRQHEKPASELPPASDCDILMAYDPAYSKKTFADFTGWCEIWVPRTGEYKHKFWLVEADHARMTTDEKIAHIFRQHYDKRPKAIFIEQDAQQKSLVETLIREAVARQCYANIVPVESGGTDKIARASSVQALFQNGTVICIRGAYPYAVDELVRLQEKNFHDDIADAIVYCVKQAQMWYMPAKGSKRELPKETEAPAEPSKIQLALKRKQKHGVHPITGERISEAKWRPAV